MESEKVKDIKETIQETIDGKLSNKYLTICEISCCPRLDIDKLFPDILTLINELESENAELKKYRVDWLNGEKMHLQAELEETEFELSSSNRLFEMVSKENKQLKDRIAELERNEDLYSAIEKLYDIMVLKRFAETFKQKCIDAGIFPAFVARKLEETLQEFIDNE